jgi:glutathione S-transferase
MARDLLLVSHALCPYVQRAAIVLAEKGAAFERRDIDLSDKPAWFLALSPLGKTPVLRVGDTAVFESAVICEYLEDTLPPRLHPADPLERAVHRGWIEFGSALLQEIAGFYQAPDAESLQARRDGLCRRFAQLEQVLQARPSGDGPYFAGARFAIVDAAFAPVFRYLDAFDRIEDFGWCAQAPRVQAWRIALALRPSVREAVAADYPQRLLAFLRARGSELSRRLAAGDQGRLAA